MLRLIKELGYLRKWSTIQNTGVENIEATMLEFNSFNCLSRNLQSLYKCKFYKYLTRMNGITEQ